MVIYSDIVVNFLRILSTKLTISQKNWKIDFSQVSKHCASFWNESQIWPLSKWVCMSLTRKCPIYVYNIIRNINDISLPPSMPSPPSFIQNIKKKHLLKNNIIMDQLKTLFLVRTEKFIMYHLILLNDTEILLNSPFSD